MAGAARARLSAVQGATGLRQRISAKREVGVGGADLEPVLDHQCGEVRVGHDVAAQVVPAHQVAEHVCVPRRGHGDPRGRGRSAAPAATRWRGRDGAAGVPPGTGRNRLRDVLALP